MPAVLSTLGRALRPHLVPLLFSAITGALYLLRRRRFLRALQRSESKRSLADVRTALHATGQATRGARRGGGGRLVDLGPVLRLAFGRREVANLAALTVALLLRTLMTLWIANAFGMAMKFFCQKDWDTLFRRLLGFVSWSLMAACTNGALKYLQASLAANLRHSLTTHAHSLYMAHMNYYKANKVGSDKLEGTDQLIADDIAKFSDELADTYSNAVKPIVDLLMFTAELWRTMGIGGPGGMYGWFVVSAVVSVLVLPPYGRLYAEEQVLEGRFRTAHAELIQNGEMVAFFRGERPEKKVLDKAFTRIRHHVLSVQEMKLPCDIIQGYVNKYLASVVGFLLVIRPVYANHDGKGSMDAADIARYFVSRRQILEGLSSSVLALFELQTKIGSLIGLGQRLGVLFRGLTQRAPLLQDAMARHAVTNPPRFVVTAPGAGVLRFDHVAVYRPDGALLIHDLNMEVKPGDRVMITGDNGCGKSSLFRVLCGLWPLVCGTITKPPPRDIYFLSQVNFVPVGSLRELIIYPHAADDMARQHKTDDDVLQALKWAHLEGLECDHVRPGLDTVMQWGTALSPGQKQRMAFARLLYHRPQYAVLDECTNGISPDVEADLYLRCRALGMAVFSISHKEELKKLHDRELHILNDGRGGYALTPIPHPPQ